MRNEIDHDNPVVGLDEMWSFLGKRKNEVWIWLALEVNSCEILSYSVGDRSVETFKRLWDGIGGESPLAYARGFGTGLHEPYRPQGDTTPYYSYLPQNGDRLGATF